MSFRLLTKFGSNKVHIAQKSKRRVKRFQISIGFSRHLSITLRRFRTRKENRSKLKKQLVTKLNIFGYREVAVVLVVNGRTKNNQLLKALTKHNTLLPEQALLPNLIMLFGTTAAIFFGAQLSSPITIDLVSTPVSASAQTEVPKVEEVPVTKVMPKSKPTRLRIPKIELNTTLSSVGLLKNGSIDVPVGYDVAAWYNKSPTPGELGPSIIVGHVDSWQGAGIFWRLRELVPGDKLKIDRQDGTVATFKITAIRQYSQNDFPTKKVYGNTEESEIRLITCSGTFDLRTLHYSHNTVIFGVLQ